VEGWGACSNCGVELVDTPPPPAPLEPKRTRPAASFLEPARAKQGDPFTPIWEGPTPEGASLARRLEAALIPVDLGEAAEPGRLRIEVPRSYVPEALGVLDAADADPDATFAPPEPDEDDTDGGYADQEPFWTWGRIAIAAVVVALVVLLIITSR
jgi:hypothetical protein